MGMRADCSSYFVTTYIQTKTTKELKKNKNKRKNKRKRKKRKLKCNKINSYI